MAQPLRKISKEGIVYQRPPAVENQIDEALRLDHAALTARAREIDERSAGYIKSECLVHLLRDAMQRGDQQLQNTLLPILLTRCEATLLSKIPANVAFAAELREEILGEFALLFVQDISPQSTGQLDYFECRFNQAFRALRITHLRRERKHTKNAVEFLDGSEVSDDCYDSDGEIVPGARPEQDDLLILSETLSVLTDDERDAVILHYAMKYEIESEEDPNAITVATLCNVSGRTIRSRLKKAKEKLAKIVQEEK